MNHGEQLGPKGGETLNNGAESFNFTPDMLPQPNILTEEQEQAPDLDPSKIGNAAVNASEYGEKPVAMGEVVDEEKPIEITQESILSTETGSIVDSDGIQPDEQKRIEAIIKNPDLYERATKKQIEAKRFLVGRYPDRAYMRGDK